jgi:hypothetical protein
LNDKRDDGFRIFFFLSRESFLKPLPDKASRSLHCWILDLTGKVRLKILLEERNKTKNRRARRETKQELEKLINAAIEEWIWSQRGQKRESEEKAIKADSGKRKGRAETVRSGRMRDSTGRKAK